MNASVAEVRIPVVGDEGPRGELVLRLPPRASIDARPAPLMIADADVDGAPRAQLLEAEEYIYEFIGLRGAVTTDHAEAFDANTPDGRTGRLRTRLYTGTMAPVVFSDGHRVGRVAFEIRSRKLNYRSEYRAMLRDLTERFVDAILLRFATTTHQFVPDPARQVGSSYQKFAFLQSVLEGGPVAEALHRLTSQPHVEWREEMEARHPGRGAPGSAGLVRQLQRPGPRTEFAFGGASGPTHLPASLDVRRTTATVDNIPNRFVKYVLRHWREEVAKLALAVERDLPEGAARDRGLRETAALIELLERHLHAPSLADVGILRGFPVANQVLERKAGYREISRAFVQAELAAQLTWSGGDDVYGAGKRDVATLYEYWAFVQVASVVSSLCHQSLDWGQLIEADESGLRVTLIGGQPAVLHGHVQRAGRSIAVSLWFNKTFRPGTHREVWTWDPLESTCRHASLSIL